MSNDKSKEKYNVCTKLMYMHTYISYVYKNTDRHTCAYIFVNVKYYCLLFLTDVLYLTILFLGMMAVCGYNSDSWIVRICR